MKDGKQASLMKAAASARSPKETNFELGPVGLMEDRVTE